MMNKSNVAGIRKYGKYEIRQFHNQNKQLFTKYSLNILQAIFIRFPISFFKI